MNQVKVRKLGAGFYEANSNNKTYSLYSMYCDGSKPQWILEDDYTQLTFEYKSSAIDHLKNN